MAQEVIEAPMVGKVIRILANEGDRVKEGDTICEIESMKMEIPIVSTASGVIKEIKISPGQTIKAGDVIVVLET